MSYVEIHRNFIKDLLVEDAVYDVNTTNKVASVDIHNEEETLKTIFRGIRTIF